jgi:hypothetical protein
MAEELFRWRPVPLKQRCDRCREAATVVLEKLMLCGDCFLEESERRFGAVSKNSTADRSAAPADARKSA